MVRSIVIEGRQLRTLADLSVSGFGRPVPRHGLMLLFWFANDCVDFDNHDNMQIQCYPERGDFGFHYFGNFEKILPILSRERNEKYFEVGNLNTESYPEAIDLLPYVRQYYLSMRYYHQCNRDRLIIRLNKRKVTATYVTEHKDNGNRGEFDPEHTHLVSPDLIRIIQQLELPVYLELTGYSGPSLIGLFRRAFKRIPDIRSQSSGCSDPDQNTWDLEQGQSTSQMEELERKRCTTPWKIFGVLVVLLVVLVVIALIVLAILDGGYTVLVSSSDSPSLYDSKLDIAVISSSSFSQRNCLAAVAA
ncbi:hypothetical protein DPEC_G00187550 [Dallia pectoralis]|uniref:Uncharacterized protein n=1 Tax=Dallia pectoralis TaxID=75939 RepID=A0ACC2GC49_DALPE|nr:hypothetical protein DPEC_G00187550 [Dallia pectoralis]